MLTLDSKELQDRYAEDGYVVLRPFLTPAKLAELLAELSRYLDQIVPNLPAEHKFFEQKGDGGTLKQLQHMDRYHPYFHRLLTASEFRQLAEMLLGGEVVPQNLQYFNKPPCVGAPTPPHQDGYYFMLDPCEALTMWLALEEVDAENGCVRYVRGSHKLGMRPHARTQTLGFSQGIVDFPTAADQDEEVAMPAGAGDLLAHDSLTIHWADGNTSTTRTRRALGLIYFSVRARQDAAAMRAYQEKLTAELQATGKL